MSMQIITVSKDSFEHYLPKLIEILFDGVKSGASIGFIEPFTLSQAEHYWLTTVKNKIEHKESILFVAMLDGEIAATVQLCMQMPPNQAHRCEVAKLIVKQQYRGKGIAKNIMNELEKTAKSMGKSLITLDTRKDDIAQNLYQSLGFKIGGYIPDFALDADGKRLSTTTYMYKKI